METNQLPLGTPHPKPCPEDGGKLLLTLTANGLGYICANKFTLGCRGNAGAHQETGEPYGNPEKEFVRSMRTLLHSVMDPLWRQYPNSESSVMRKRIYEFMRMKLVEADQLKEDDEFHIAELNEEQLAAALKIAQNDLRRSFL